MIQVQWNNCCLGVGYIFSFLANRSLQENGDQKVESKIEEVSLLTVAVCLVLRTPFHLCFLVFSPISLFSIPLKAFKALDLCLVLSF